MKGRIAKLRRVQELFTEGRIVVLENPAGDVEAFWVSKPTAFERDEALKDARSARARRALRFDSDTDEQQVVLGQMATMETDDLVATLVGAKANEHYVKALDELKADKDWSERIEVMDRSGLEADRDSTAADRAVVRTITTEYLLAIDTLIKKYDDELRTELVGVSDEDLRRKYRETWRDMTAFESFMETRRVSEMFFALRLCEPTPVDDEWVHDDCDHRVRLLDRRDEVYDLPDALVTAVRGALEELQMTPREAGNSAAPPTSSGSSEPQSEVEDSPASTPAETSLVPAGT